MAQLRALLKANSIQLNELDSYMTKSSTITYHKTLEVIKTCQQFLRLKM